MGLETFGFIDSLNASNPVGASDPKSQGDDHIRGIKSTLKTTFPAIAGAVTLSHTQLNNAVIKNETNVITKSGLRDASALHLQASQAGMYFEATGADVDEGHWGWEAYDSGGVGTMRLSSVSDADAFAAAAMTFTRNGTSILKTQFDVASGEFEINATTVDINGSIDLSGSMTLASGQPRLLFQEAGQAADEGNWILDTDAARFRLATATDGAPSARSTNAIDISRSGATVTEIELNATTVDINGAVEISGGLTLDGNSCNLSGTTPRYALIETDASVDSGRWDFYASADILNIRAINDAQSGANNAVRILRSGVTVTEIELNATTIDINGSILNTSAYIEIENASPQIFLIETDAAADNGKWRWLAAGEDMYLGPRNDANSAGAAFLTATRTGTTTDSLALAATTLTFTGNVSVAGSSAQEVGYAGAPSRNISASTNTAATDNGKRINMNGGSGQTFTLDSDPPTDAVVLITNNSGNNWTIAASTLLIWAADASTGNRTLGYRGIAIAVHLGGGTWMITGSALLS